jgi:hypothetical protein
MNTFKTNSRFDILSETSIETDKKYVEKSFKSDENSFKRNDRSTRISTDRNEINTLTNKYTKEQLERKSIEERCRKEKEEKDLIRSLSQENFPGLTTNSPIKQNTSIIGLSYFDKITSTVGKAISINEEELEYANLKPGWVLIKKDSISNKIITKHKCICKTNIHNNPINNNENDIINALVELHEKRTNEYIELWGYDEWEKMFRFTNYDYDYFDNLDEIYDAEIANEYDVEDDTEFITDSDKFNNYWKH